MVWITTGTTRFFFPFSPNKVIISEVHWRVSKSGDETSKTERKWKIGCEVKWRSLLECVYYHWFIIMYFLYELFYTTFCHCYLLCVFWNLLRSNYNLCYSFYVSFLLLYVLLSILCVRCFCIVFCMFLLMYTVALFYLCTSLLTTPTKWKCNCS